MKFEKPISVIRKKYFANQVLIYNNSLVVSDLKDILDLKNQFIFINKVTEIESGLPKSEEIDIQINEDDIRTDVFHSGGAGGQNVNKVATAIRLTHNPSGIVVACQNERSQLQNKMQAMEILKSKLWDLELRKQQEEISKARKSQVGSGERSEKIRTYNYPQSRITDHRIGLTLYNLEEVLEGKLDGLIEQLIEADQLERMKS